MVKNHFVNTISYKGRSWEFYQIYTFAAVVDKNEPIKFWGQGHRVTTHGQSTLTYFRNAWTYFNDT